MTDPRALPSHPEFQKRRTLRTAADLVRAGLVKPERMEALQAVAERYAVAVTPALADLMDVSDPGDPIVRQFVPDPRELDASPDDMADPIGDEVFSPVKGVVHRYPDRVLLTPILHCPVYCRFCFRREKVGGEEAVLAEADLDAALDYIRAHDEVWEVILTGGDPLMLSAAKLKSLMAALDTIPHVQVIRIHSRIPVGDPDRIGPALLDALAATGKALWLAVHCNHPKELSASAEAALRRLSGAGIPLLGQSVLLKGVNDDPDTLAALMKALVRNRVKPYYLHHPDLAPGTAHFRLSIEEGQKLVAGLRGRISGLAQPTYVLDIPGGHGKSPAAKGYVGDGEVTDWQGRRHDYPTK
ncbi:MAG TPA: lysine-2,3-aminomutase-like protein [Candidatus Sulfotelmatobacter sp.]|jgi:lysine 2,3-aminomutase|nr:lysine-2,3-aminomutase-like protein [Candidatus Sulfotelmatobacter sp.]